MNFFGFGATPEIEICLDGEDRRKMANIRTENGKREQHIVYYNGETITGQVKITFRKTGGKFEHQGIRIEIIGQIEMVFDRGHPVSFLSLYRDLARPGELLSQQSFHFEFPKVGMPYESYTGINCKLRYFLRASIIKRLSDVMKEREIIVHSLEQFPDINSSIKMEVGVEDALHIEFEYNRSKYHLKDVIVGKIYFLLVRIKIKHMELAIIKRETAGAFGNLPCLSSVTNPIILDGPTPITENETIAKFEIMDGAPVRGESIPIRVFLSGYDLTPTFRDVNRKFSVRYFLNLVIVDEDDRRFYKQQEILLCRKVEKQNKTFQATLQQQWREMRNPNAPVASSSRTARAQRSLARAGQSTSSLNTTSSPDSNDLNVSSVSSANEAFERAVDRLPNSMSAMRIGTRGEAYDETDGPTLASGGFPSGASKPASGRHRSSRLSVTNEEPACPSPFSPDVVGIGKTLLSGDDSDDDAPTLTGSTCQADVHFHHMSSTDAQASATVEIDLNDEEDKEE